MTALHVLAELVLAGVLIVTVLLVVGVAVEVFTTDYEGEK